jgi:anthranilate/para-aminobenzoate synthase component II
MCDAALLFFVWHHVVDRERAAQELRRVVKPGGKLFVQTNFSDRMPDVWWFRLVPEWRRVDTAQFRSEDEVKSDFAGAGWTFVSRDQVTWLRSANLAEDVEKLRPDGVFLANGPGDPEPCDYAIVATRHFLEKKVPVFGICLGHQLLGLAAGGKTLKMKFGHHGANHPVIDLETGRVMITSQNHGFAVDEASLPANVRATQRSLFDGSSQGIEFTDRPAYSFQGHPEASPGPHDAKWLFEKFIKMMEERRA